MTGLGQILLYFMCIYSQQGGIKRISVYSRFGRDGVLFLCMFCRLVVNRDTDESLTDNGLLSRLAGGESQLLGSELRLFGRVARW